MKPVLTPELEKTLRRRYVRGVYGLERLAKEYGVSTTTVRRAVIAGYRERQQTLSREAKRRRTGICSVCGCTTRYNGSKSPISERCVACANRATSLQRRGTGSNGSRVLNILGSGPMRYQELHEALGLPSHGHTNGLLARLRSYGLVERPSRGVYQLTDSARVSSARRGRL